MVFRLPAHAPTRTTPSVLSACRVRRSPPGKETRLRPLSRLLRGLPLTLRVAKSKSAATASQARAAKWRSSGSLVREVFPAEPGALRDRCSMLAGFRLAGPATSAQGRFPQGVVKRRKLTDPVWQSDDGPQRDTQFPQGEEVVYQTTSLRQIRGRGRAGTPTGEEHVTIITEHLREASP
jgi:hypothetical protein